MALLVLPMVVPLAGKAMPAVGRRASRAFGALCVRVGVVFFAFVGGWFLQTGQRVAAGRVAPALIVADDAAWGDRVFVGACTALLGAMMPGVGVPMLRVGTSGP
ncbi:MAG: hypothetical protein ACN6RD_11410, partial [Stenotrophomonas maltophilia]